MFNNLIESSSHKNEIKRRGSFLLFTSITYALMFAIAGVASIYAYDARLNEQNLEIVTMVPVELMEPEQPPTPFNPTPPRGGGENNDPKIPHREIAMARADQPEIVPEGISTAANKNLPLPRFGPVRLGEPDSDPGGGGSKGSDGDNNGRNTNPLVVTVDPPTPPDPKPKPVQQIIRKQIINSEAISLPVPRYPEIARNGRIQGVVLVQVLIDESGKVVSAQIVRGNPLLAGAAKQAAFLARFSPTKIGDQTVKVSGTITYNFVMN